MAKVEKKMSKLTIPKREAASASVVTYLESVVKNEEDLYRYLSVGEIQLNPENDYNQYDSEENILVLAEDIKRNGLLHNIVISQRQDGTAIMLSGERRLKAYRYLNKEHPKDSYDKIFAKIRTNLSPQEERIIVDAANLMARGGIENEYKRRLASVRFVKSIQEQFPELKKEEAVKITASITGVSTRMLGENLSLETQLLPEIRQMLNSGLLNKDDALLLAAAPKEYQDAFVSLQKELQKRIEVNEIQQKKAFSELTADFLETSKEAGETQKSLKKYDTLISRATMLSEKTENPVEKKLLEEQIETLVHRRQEVASKVGLDVSGLVEKIAAPKTAEQRLKNRMNRGVLTLEKTISALEKPALLKLLKEEENRKYALEAVQQGITRLQELENHLKNE